MMTMKTNWMALAAAALTATMMTATPQDASACGGLVCDGGGPQAVNQAAERIIFAKNPDGSTTAVVQILYSGPTSRFGWMLPVPGIPEVGLSSDAAFARLQAATNPVFQMNTTVEGNCKNPVRLSFPGSAKDASAAANNGSFNNGAGGIEVLDSGSTGPYDYVVLQVDTENGGNVQMALDWLEANNYQPPNTAPDLLEPYFEEGYNLLAIRLQKTSDNGSIRPIKLTYDSDHPMIPIKLTALAANDDMGVLVWVLGPNRAVPLNYKALEINDALINWFNPAPTYNDVVNVAANEASGQGFVTEWATSAPLEVIFTDSDEADFQRVAQAKNVSDALDEAAMLYGANFNNQGFNGLTEAVEATFPTLNASEVMRATECGSCAFDGGVPEEASLESFVQAVDDFIVAPMRETQELFDQAAYATRLYTTMSADEMTIDPSFGFNPDLEDVSNQMTAERYIECSKKVEQFEAPWRVELPSGLVVRGEGSTWPVSMGDDGMMPATLTVSEVGESGKPTIVRDNIEAVRKQLDLSNAAFPTPGGCGCATTDGGRAVDAGLLAASFGLVFLRRRRR